MRVSVDDDRARLAVGLPARCAIRPSAKLASALRQARTHRLPGTPRHDSFGRALELPGRDRWFVYVEMRRDGRPVESWLPIDAGDGDRTVSEEARYAYIPPEPSGSAIKSVSGVLLYGGVLALLYATFLLFRASRGDGSGPGGRGIIESLTVLADHGSSESRCCSARRPPRCFWLCWHSR